MVWVRCRRNHLHPHWTPPLHSVSINQQYEHKKPDNRTENTHMTILRQVRKDDRFLSSHVCFNQYLYIFLLIFLLIRRIGTLAAHVSRHTALPARLLLEGPGDRSPLPALAPDPTEAVVDEAVEEEELADPIRGEEEGGDGVLAVTMLVYSSRTTSSGYGTRQTRSGPESCGQRNKEHTKLSKSKKILHTSIRNIDDKAHRYKKRFELK